MLAGAVGEEHAAGVDDALVVGEAAEGAVGRVEPVHGAGRGVDDEVAPPLLLVGADPQQDEGADAGVGEVGVGQRLERFGDGLAVGRGVVLAGGDGEVAADGGDADALGDGDVGVAAEHVVVAGGRGPFDAGAAGCGLAGVALAPGVEEGDGAVGRDGPAQHPQVRHALAGPEDGEQLLPGAPQAQQPGPPVVAVQGGELGAERRVVEESGYGVLGQRRAVAGVEREDVPDGGPAPGGDGVGQVAHAEQQHVAEGGEVGGAGRVGGAQGEGAGGGRGGRPERLGAAGVQRPGPAGQFARLGGEPVPQHVVGGTVEPGRGLVGGLVLGLRGGGRGGHLLVLLGLVPAGRAGPGPGCGEASGRRTGGEAAASRPGGRSPGRLASPPLSPPCPPVGRRTGPGRSCRPLS